ncbi:hypothetical protein BDN70DRAFT_944918 [Pholiota conissans]|uniref:Uncharacterized protein n=1 Tax=Pholiota conissans TaxID=109636 RepID=A0A9P5Z1V3_9AGAR|nr:hypothetical protein BDN70DRAFT_944918 [Pholiota conissans]
MDPLSITLAVVTLATALRDIIETANAIRDTFSKRPQNFRNAQRLARWVLKTLEEMRDIYQENKAIFDGSKHLEKTMRNLQVEIQAVYDLCAPLASPISERLQDRFKTALCSFWSRKKVERLISELYDHVEKCFQQFLVLSSVRTEVRVVEMHKTLRLLADASTSNASRANRNPGRGQGDRLHDRPVGSASNAHLFAFTESSSMSMTRIADTVPIHVLSDAYLRRELGRVNVSLSSTLHRWLQHPPAEPEFSVRNQSWFLEASQVAEKILHQSTIVLAFRMEKLLSQAPNTLLFDTIDATTRSLCWNLVVFRMYDEAILLCHQQIDFWRAMRTQYRSRPCSCRLAEVLTFLGFVYSYKDKSQAYSISEEAIQLFQSLLADDEPDVMLKMAYTAFLNENIILQILSQSQTRHDANKAPQRAIDAGKALEKALGLDLLSEMDISDLLTSNGKGVSALAAGSAKIFLGDVSDDNAFSYAQCLYDIAKVQLDHHQYVASNNFAKLALKILNHILAKYPDSGQAQTLICCVLQHLTWIRMRPLNTANDNLEYTLQNTTLVRKFALINPQRNVMFLARALWSQREALLDLDRSSDAEKVYREMISLGDLAATPPHLGIKIPSETEGNYYFFVACRHYHAERFIDAIYTAQNAIHQFSALEFMEPDYGPRKEHINSLAMLCQSLTASHLYDDAVSEGFKALNIIDRFCLKFDLIREPYQDILDSIMKALEASCPDHGSLLRAKAIVTRIQGLARSSEVNSCQWKWAWTVWTPISYAELLEKNDMVEEALEYLQETCTDLRGTMRWHEKSETTYESMAEHGSCLLELCGILENKNDIQHALEYTEEAIQLCEELSEDTFFSDLLDIMAPKRIRLLCTIGRYSEALELNCTWAANIHKADPSQRNDAVLREVLSLLAQARACLLGREVPLPAINTVIDAISACQMLSADDDRLLPYIHLQLSVTYANLEDFVVAAAFLYDAEEGFRRQQNVLSTDGLKFVDEDACHTIVKQRSRLSTFYKLD